MKVNKTYLATAQKYVTKRSMGAGSGSTLRKVAKALRIAAGQPYPMPRPRRGNTILHPTKGWVQA